MDCGGARLTGEGKLECVATLREGEVVFDPEARSMPDWQNAPAPIGQPPAQRAAGRCGSEEIMLLNDRDQIIAMTAEWTGERYPNGRPA